MSIKEKVQKMVNHFCTTTKEMSRENSLSRFTGNADTEESDEHNRNFSEVLEVNNEEISYNCSSTIERQKERAITREEYRRIENVVSQVGDNFDEIFAIENTPNSELENQIVEEVKENFIDGYAKKKNDEEIKKEEEEKHLIIDDIKIVTAVVKTGVQQSQTVTNENTPHLREYNNKPKFYKPVFGKAKTGENNLKKYLFMAISSVAVGIFGGVEANSYYLAVGGKVPNTLSCSWGWLTMFDTMTPNISPFYANVFFTAFAIWGSALGLVFLLGSMNSAEKKASRVGHEHGNMRLSTKSDFKKYINKFMD